MVYLAVHILKYGPLDFGVCFPAQFNFQEILSFFFSLFTFIRLKKKTINILLHSFSQPILKVTDRVISSFINVPSARFKGYELKGKK